MEVKKSLPGRNGVKAGYKQTEVGVIPEDWEVVYLGDMAIKVGSGITPTGGERVYKKEGRPFLRSQNVGWGLLLMDDIAFIDDFTHNIFKGTEIQPDDVFLNITGASIGRSAVADIRVQAGNVNQHVCIIRTVNSKLNPRLLNLFLLSKAGQKQIDSFQAGGNRQGLNFGQIRSFQIPLPPTIAEQAAIATALSDADALIQSLEKLIAKKRLIKQGAMQELLKPKEGWVVKKLGEVLDYEQPIKYLVTDTEYNDNNDTPVLTAGKTFILGCTNEDFGIYKKNLPVIIFDDFTTATKYVDFPFKVKSSAMKILRKKYKKVNLRFIFEIMQQINFPLGDHKRHWIAEYQNIEIRVPKPEEQTRIATILSDMDAEISALETKLTKYKQIKQGMMQNLLTGKIRLVDMDRG